MSRNDPTKILVAVHLDQPHRRNAILVSINGEASRAEWVPRALIETYQLTGKSTSGTDKDGSKITLPLANMTVPEWLAQDRGFI